jgi:drug/metabolite transporter (DMT)-like permease
LAKNRTAAVVQALVAAVLFGASAPLAKLLLGQIEPVLLAAVLYLGSGIGLLCVRPFLPRKSHTAQPEAQIARSDLPWLAGAILAGGVAAPIVLLISLKNTPAAPASLLLNFEGVATAVLAVLVFGEEVGRRALWSVALITISSVLLALDPAGGWGLSIGALGIVLACILWGIDNNFTRNVSAKDPLTIVTIKGLAAGTVSLAIAISLGNQLPAPGIIVRAMLLGCLSYGLSIVLFIRAMRALGAARTSTLFGTSPLVGVILSLVLFRGLPNWLFWIALSLMVIAAWLLLNEKHEHEHFHELLVHEHSHLHDDAHHEHDHGRTLTRSHSHTHRHEESRHAHDHMPDVHHRHGRRREK